MSNKRTPIGDKVTIYPRGKKNTYYADFHHNGRHCRKSLKTKNFQIAKKRAIKLEAELIDGEYKPPAPAVKLADAKEQFIAAMREAGRKHKTITKYEREISDLVAFAADHGATTLKDFTPELFNQYRKQRKE